MDLELFMQMLSIESTSGSERPFAEFLATRLKTDGCTVQTFEVGDGTLNLLFSWGTPEIVFCTHMDTVPPYIVPNTEKMENGDMKITGRGSCDAKGQIFSQYSACVELEKRGCSGFGLLLLSGEETGSFGAKAFVNQWPGAKYVIVGEPTDGAMVSASKGTKSFALTFRGKSFHSGYPEMGESAVEKFVDFMNKLRSADFPIDPVLGNTTYNVGKLVSDNPQNILSDCLKCRVYFRTTFASDKIVEEWMSSLEGVEVEAFGGDTPMHYTTLEGFKRKTVAFGSDTPRLTNFENKILCGPGSILVAHRDEENILLSELQEGMDNCIRFYEMLKEKK
ncbi:MAG: M20/M25/M40 family metallo-hydrolase [Bacteroidales bacterium]|nr:M20/M25/M40 family metallo-hydrolase [Bacteroidales bacterium]